jgi:hypothetical protein
MTALAATGLLSAGSGAESYKTPGNAPGLVTLPSAQQPIQIQMAPQQVVLNNQVVGTIMQQTFVGMLGAAGDSIQLQQAP